MKVKEISYGRTFANPTKFEFSRIDFTITLDEGEDEKIAFEDLMDLVYDARQAELPSLKENY